MNRPGHFYLNNMGVLVRLTPRRMRAYLRAVADGLDVTPEPYGVVLGGVRNVTDLEPSDARDWLEDLR